MVKVPGESKVECSCRGTGGEGEEVAEYVTECLNFRHVPSGALGCNAPIVQRSTSIILL